MDHGFKCYCTIRTIASVLILLSLSLGIYCQLGQELISGGSETTIQHFPHHVGIYKNHGAPDVYDQICGGTLISTTLVVTAAHCFWNKVTNAQNDSSLYRVAAGKTHRSWKFASDPSSVQRRKVAKLTLPRRYLGRDSSLAKDIAIVTLDRPVKLTSSVALVDIDWNDAWTNEQLASESNGTVCGWGITESGIFSDTLKFVSIPYVDPDTCFDSLTPDLRKFVTHDKFCAGYLNSNISMCPGDSGGGLVFHHEATGKNFLRGVVSFAFRPANFKGKCFAQHYVAFTLVSAAVLRGLNTKADQGILPRMEQCGRRGRRATPLIAGGQAANEAEFPWNAVVYSSKRFGELRYSCGGSLISIKHVVSGAYCFYDESNSRVDDYGLYRISLGSIRRSYNETVNLPTAQTFGVAAITIHPGYFGRKGYYSNSIAVVRLDRAATLTPTVAPVCVDWDGAYQGDLRDGAKGVVAGLGMDSSGLANSLQWIELPYVNLETCARYAVNHIHGIENFVSAPNFCVGEVNKSRAICPGDAGGGFSVLHESNQRYYLRGLVSISMQPGYYGGACYAQAYTVIQTIASPFVEWIWNVILSAPK